jgi:WD40 repeat protein
MKFSADGSHVISVGYGTDRADPELDVVSVWDWRTGERVQVLATKGGSAPAVDPAGRYIAISRFNGNEVDIWDASSYELVATLTNSPALIRNLSFSPDGTRLVSAGFDGALRVWDTATWDEQQRIDTPNPLVNAWFVDDETITSIDQTGMARTWTLDLDELIAIATSPLTRELTDAECRQYLQLDVCPVA